MRRSAAWTLVLLTLPMLASAGKDEPEAAPDPEALKNDPCPTVPPTGYRLALGQGNGRNRAEALQAAREDARRRLMEDVGSGYSPIRQAAIRRHMVDWKEGAYKPFSACAAVAIETSALNSFEKDAQKMEADVATLAVEVQAAAAGKVLQIDPPVWPSGCVADVGADLAAQLRSEFGRARADVRLLESGQSAPEALRLRMELAPGPSGVVVSALLLDPASVGGKPLHGFSFPLDLLQIDAGEVGKCRSDVDLGLRKGEKVGAGGLRVRMEVETRDGRLCEGQTVTPRLVVNQPAQVRVFSVAPGGESLLVWPPPGQPGRVEPGEIPLDRFRMLQVGAGDERLVALAVPAGGSLGEIGRYGGYCLVEGGLGPDDYGSDAALGAVTYSIVSAGTGECPWIEGIDAEIETARRQMAAMKPCRP